MFPVAVQPDGEITIKVQRSVKSGWIDNFSSDPSVRGGYLTIIDQ